MHKIGGVIEHAILDLLFEVIIYEIGILLLEDLVFFQQLFHTCIRVCLLQLGELFAFLSIL